MGFLVEKDSPMIWRGPMVMGAVEQLLHNVAWDDRHEVDVMVIDLPPGTGVCLLCEPFSSVPGSHSTCILYHR